MNGMRRTTATLDEVLLRDAQRVLGTHGVNDTVNAALAACVRHALIDSFDVRDFEFTDDDLAVARARSSRRDSSCHP